MTYIFIELKMNSSDNVIKTVNSRNLNVLYLNQFHDKIEVIVGVHFLNQQYNVWMLHTPKDGYFTVYHVLLDDWDVWDQYIDMS